MTIDEELNILEESVRRLKIEYDVYFGGGSKRPPNDTEWRVNSLIKKHGDNGKKLNYAQRFRYNTIAQKYAIFSDLWRQKMKIKEEGYRRPQDAMLGIQGLRTDPPAEAPPTSTFVSKLRPFKTSCSDVDADAENVQTLYQAMVDAKRRAGEQVSNAASFDNFKAFVRRKTEQIRKDHGCRDVEYSVELKDGQVKLKARAKI
ncbi:MAG TPA: MXAN_5187 C-terminal domain-containing protein [Clostridia bacterium]|nr:MXAN_5187 C-terminal domain-containing protein [Clostridia bacterium]